MELWRRHSSAALALSLLLLLAPAARGCVTDSDCSLNGACVGGVCECVSFWGGADCAVVQFARVPGTAGDGALIASSTQSRWCAGVLQDDAGAWHAYSAMMDLHCGLNSWQHNSVITHATSVNAAATGPYANESIIFGYFSHNPKPIRAPDGTYLVFHIGCGGNTGTPISRQALPML